MKLTSPAFSDGDSIPRRYTCEGEDLSPPFVWDGIPAGTVSLLLACEDPDAPRRVFCHWVAFNIPPDLPGLEEDAASSAGKTFRQAVNDFGHPGYNGPCPPHGDRPHRYHFRLMALDRMIPDLSPSAKGADVVAQARPYATASAGLIGTFARG
ncbi:YbhB/YbcL family Raf kinase inhibitor-like protein [Microvirga flavescens]|uniref:YbhB/YbcL family Raf kinase inhibitor-like protein n=1 Tax=Microvirga flavescens TaxID=2249811 RepID=UPI000DDBA5F6|nr:YbhB/YbcL family Raf kinase inhibitor-like protein [Microvirga flavescens]